MQLHIDDLGVCGIIVADWDITKEFKPKTITTDYTNWLAYISRRHVPANTPITDTYYWKPLVRLQQQPTDYNQFKEEITNRVNNLELAVEISATEAVNGMTPSSYSAGDIFYIGDENKRYYVAPQGGNVPADVTDHSRFPFTDSSVEAVRLSTFFKLQAKQDTLVSGQNIKTINHQSILGSGNIMIDSSGGIFTQEQSNWTQTDSTQVDYIKNKPTNVSAFTNDAGYLTQHQDISKKADKSEVTAENTRATAVEAYLQNQINAILAQLTGISATVSPNTVYAGNATIVHIVVNTTMTASSIKVKRGTQEIASGSDTNTLTCNDSVASSVAPGTNITYTIEAVMAGSTKSIEKTVTVLADYITDITWTGGSVSPSSVIVGGTATLTKGTVKAVYASGREVDVTSSAEFNASIGTISGTTYNAPNSAGNDTISVSYGGKTASNTLSVTVIAKQSTNIQWSASSYEATIGGTNSFPTLSGTSGLSGITYNSSNPNAATINSSGVITLVAAGTTTITATYAGDSTHLGSSDNYILTVKSAAPTIPDYYIGWATGENSSFDGFAALTDTQLKALANGYNKSTQSSITKNVTAAEATGSRQIFFLMWKQGSEPQSGSVTSGGITENLSAADFVDTNVFRATHADVTIDGTSYHVAGMRGAFDAGDTFIINF